jgi:hypothetical protein
MTSVTSEVTEGDLEVVLSNLDTTEITGDEQLKIESWLDEHPDFFQEYLIRKGRKMSFLVRGASEASCAITNIQGVQSKFEQLRLNITFFCDRTIFKNLILK